MTQETKNTVAAETIVENLKEFAMELHQSAKESMLGSLIEKDKDTFVLANFAHNISHVLIDILQGNEVKSSF
ncbi:hypothetical protein [Streptococcus dysgalactiae]|uniref:hypothetical protein n=1 Tax=Streptococcus dysgalactiae TaxID=1334 RepID=UPI0012A8CACA|nr:hypothetical protein [Streptococcus dysgalactiae]QGH05095.1 hypothetical protein EA458_11970 [Streptococcus dysgalactiae subsp. dysgalactiae]